jgi:hypothetical protein
MSLRGNAEAVVLKRISLQAMFQLPCRFLHLSQTQLIQAASPVPVYGFTLAPENPHTSHIAAGLPT